VGAETHDDAAVYKLSDTEALVVTVDYFPPVAPKAYDYGAIAATNALSDIYAMGGKPLMALNIALFPTGWPLSVLSDILQGGQSKVAEAGAVLLGGHTITNNVPVYGLAVVGIINSSKIVTNNNAKAGDVLILTKPLGTGINLAAFKAGLINEAELAEAIINMQQLNAKAGEIMLTHRANAATDITGFGLLGHALKMALASEVTLQIEAANVPVLDNAYRLAEMGALNTALFNNQAYAAQFCHFNVSDFNLKAILYDAQSSGGLLISLPAEQANSCLMALRQAGCCKAALIGQVVTKKYKSIIIN